MPAYIMLYIAIISFQVKPSPLILGDNITPLRREYFITKIRFDSNFPANSDTLGSCTLEYVKTLDCDVSEGFVSYPDEDRMLISSTYQVTWPNRSGSIDTVYQFETSKGLYIDNIYFDRPPSSYSADRLLSRPIDPHTEWRDAPDITNQILNVDKLNIDGQDRTIVLVESSVDILPDRYLWALDYGILYIRYFNIEPDGCFFYEYIEKEHMDLIMNHPFTWKTIPKSPPE
jgi:hypothetical protein